MKTIDHLPLFISRRRHVLATLLGLALLVLFTFWQRPPYEGWHYGRGEVLSISFHAQFIVFVMGIIILAWGMAGAPFTLPRRPSTEVWAVGGVVLLALLLRLVGAGETVRVLVDELNTIAEVRALQQTPDIKLLWPMTGISPFTWLFAYWQYSGVQLLGHNLAGLRFASAVTGAVSILPLYLLARALFNRRVALCAAVLFATFPPHLHFSRLALLNIADALWGVLALAFLARGLQHNRPADWLLGGVALGLTQYFYEGGRLFFPIFAAVWCLWLMVIGHRGRIGGMARFWGMALIIGAPLYIAWTFIDAPLAGRMGDAALGLDYWLNLLLSAPADGWLAVQLDQIARAFALYVLLPDQSTFYGGQTALLLPALVPFFLFGLYKLVRHPRDLPFVLPLWLCLLALSNGLFMLNSAAATRYIGAMPALVLVTAYGLVMALDAIGQRFPRLPATALMVIVISALAIGQTAYYFAVHLPFYNVQIRQVRPWRDVEDAVFRSLAFAEDVQVHIITTYSFDAGYAREMATFLSGQLRDIETRFNAEVDAAYFAALPRDVDHAFFIAPDDSATLSLLKVHFNTAAPQFSPYAVPPDEQFALYYAPAAAQMETP